MGLQQALQSRNQKSLPFEGHKLIGTPYWLSLLLQMPPWMHNQELYSLWAAKGRPIDPPMTSLLPFSSFTCKTCSTQEAGHVRRMGDSFSAPDPTLQMARGWVC